MKSTTLALCLLLAAAGGFDDSDYATVLKTHVNERGMVDYRALKAEPGRLNAFVRDLGRLDRRTYEGWTDEQKVAFWLNAYNGLTLKVIVDHYPIQPTFPARLYHPHNSIRQIKGVWDEIEFTVMGRGVTLEGIEHETLREDFDEPRIHAALVCAAMGCPPLRREPYAGERLDEQLDGQMRAMLSHPEKFRIDRSKDRVYISPIFKWFGEDFVGRYGTDTEFRGFGEEERAVLNGISDYVSEAERRYLLSADYKLRYLDYDWSLNEQ